MIRFCHISPTPYLERYTKHNGAHLILAHLVEEDPAYRDFYANLKDGKTKIMDNSAFEMYKQGRDMYPSDKLIEMGNAVAADVIVMSDYPGDPAERTIAAAMTYGPKLKEAGFKTFFVPQSKIGDLEDYIACFKWAVGSPGVVDMIGVSILGVPNAFGVERNNKLQRYVSRLAMMNILKERGILAGLHSYGNKERLHFLGMVDGPREIQLMKEYHEYIYSWDSSAAVWAGLNGIEFDSSPTGMVDGKFEKEVDFNFSSTESDPGTENDQIVKRNIKLINKMCGGGVIKSVKNKSP